MLDAVRTTMSDDAVGVERSRGAVREFATPAVRTCQSAPGSAEGVQDHGRLATAGEDRTYDPEERGNRQHGDQLTMSPATDPLKP
jgi:hypothetical protein